MNMFINKESTNSYMKIGVTIVLLFLLAASVFASSGTTVDGNTRVELVYITEIGDSNMYAGDGNFVDFATDDLPTGPVVATDGNRAILGVFYTDFELTNYHLYVTLIDPRCYTINSVNLLRFNVFSQLGQPITDINYILNGNPGLDLNGFCFGNDSNKTCSRLDPNIIPFVTNTVTIFASNGVNVESVTCDFNFSPYGGNSIIMVPRPDWVMFLLLILIIGGVVVFIVYGRRDRY